MKIYPIESSFLTTIPDLTWSEYFEAYKKNLIDLNAFIDLAIWTIEHTENYDEEILQLASESQKNFYVIEKLAETLSKKCPFASSIKKNHN